MGNSVVNSTIIPIILAAGKSSRFGSENKLLYCFPNYKKSILELSVQAFLGLFSTIVVVTGHDNERVERLLNTIDQSLTKIEYVHNKSWNRGGMSSSVRVGTEYVKRNFLSKGILIHPGDIPYIKKKDIYSIIVESTKFYHTTIIIPCHNKKNGHPLFVPRICYNEILQITEQSQGLRSFLNNTEIQKQFVQCSSGILKDIDKIEDIERI